MTRNEKALKARAGFTLLEVVIAVAIVGVALMMLLSSVNRNLDIAAKSRDAQIAALLGVPGLRGKCLPILNLRDFPTSGKKRENLKIIPASVGLYLYCPIIYQLWKRI